MLFYRINYKSLSFGCSFIEWLVGKKNSKCEEGEKVRKHTTIEGIEVNDMHRINYTIIKDLVNH